MYYEWHGVYDFVVLSVVEVSADYGGVNVFHVCLNLASSMVLGSVSLSVLLYGVCLHFWACLLCCDVV